MANYYRRILVATLVILSLFLGSLIILKRIERPIVFYDSYKEMVQKKAFQSGWIPLWVPDLAKNIHASHDIDTNQVWLTFTYLKVHEFNLQICHPLKKENVVFPRNRTLDLFSSFVHNMERDLATNPHLKFFRCDNSGESFMATNRQNGTVHFWHLGH